MRGATPCRWVLFLALWALILIEGLVVDFFLSNRAPSAPPDPFYNTSHLDCDIWWFGPDNQRQKHTPGGENPFFNASAPRTVIFTHGWAVNSHKTQSRETFAWKENQPKVGLDVYTAEQWIMDGWNVGIFYWNQIADENRVQNAEEKIFTTNGPTGMRWRQTTGRWSTEGSPSVPVGALFLDRYASALSSLSPNTTKEIRLVGHSLGGSVVSTAAELIMASVQNGTLADHLAPKRVSLLDPYFSPGKKEFLGGETTAHSVSAMLKRVMAQGVVVDIHKTSLATSWPFGLDYHELKLLSAFSERDPAFVHSGLDLQSKHMAASNLYFLSYADYTASDSLSTEAGPCARSSLEDICRFMGQQTKYHQMKGRDTQRTVDDTFGEYHAALGDHLLIINSCRSMAILVAGSMVILVRCWVRSISFVSVQAQSSWGHMLAVSIAGVMVSAYVTRVTKVSEMDIRALIVSLFGIIWALRPSLLVIFFASRDHGGGLNQNSDSLESSNGQSDTVSFSPLVPVSRFDAPVDCSPVPQDISCSRRLWFDISQLVYAASFSIPFVVVNSLPFVVDISIVDVIAWCGFFVGFSLEAWADLSYLAHIASVNDAQSTSTSTTGATLLQNGDVDVPPDVVWRYTQNPQLLGELMCGWALFMSVTQATVGAIFSPSYVWLCATGPVATTFSILCFRLSRQSRYRLRLFDPAQHEGPDPGSASEALLGSLDLKSPLSYQALTPALVPVPRCVHVPLTKCWDVILSFVTLPGLIGVTLAAWLVVTGLMFHVAHQFKDTAAMASNAIDRLFDIF